jgi:hypothetical protein
MAKGELMEIGNFIKLDPNIDQESRVTDYVRNNLAVVDLLPVDYNLTIGNLGNAAWATTYDFKTAVAPFQESCDKYGLEACEGLRLWITDDTTAVDDISSEFELNIIEKGMNSLAGYSKSLKAAIGTIASISSDTGTKIKEAITSDNPSGDAVSAGTETAAGMIIQGKRVGLPKIWSGTRYDPTLSLNLKLVSPYGNPTSVMNYIVKPLTYLLVLGAPKTNDGVSSGLVKPIRVTAYGISNMNLAYIRNINIRRGGRESSYNIHRQPLVIDISMTISPLVEGFGAVEKINDIATVEDVKNFKASTTVKSGPAITTVGNIIQSFVPAPDNEIVFDEKKANTGEPMGDRKEPPTNIASGRAALSGGSGSMIE